MKHSRVLLFAGLACVLPVLAADEEKEKGKAEAARAVQVILKRISQPSGEPLDEVSATFADTFADSGARLNGRLAINLGSLNQPKYWTVEFSDGDENGKDVLYLNVNDTSLLTRGVREGKSWTAPVELFRVTAPFSRSEPVTVYRTKTESLTLVITPVADSDKETPKAK